jgi:hypothetical protein
MNVFYFLVVFLEFCGAEFVRSRACENIVSVLGTR